MFLVWSSLAFVAVRKPGALDVHIDVILNAEADGSVQIEIRGGEPRDFLAVGHEVGRVTDDPDGKSTVKSPLRIRSRQRARAGPIHENLPAGISPFDKIFAVAADEKRGVPWALMLEP